MVAWTDDWVAGAVQPAAIAWFGQGVKEIRTAGAYSCRRRNHRANAKLSEHAFGNAIDVMSFVLNDGNVVTVKGGWRGTETEQGFLRDVFHGACQRFKTVLGPGSDALHYDHFHLDLAHHDSKGQRRYCKPFVAAPQRPQPGTSEPGAPSWGGPPNPYAFNQPSAGMPQRAPLGPALPAPNNGMLAGRSLAPQARPPQTEPQPPRDDFDVANGGNKELEPEFDPREFDLRTGSIPDLPRPRTPASRVEPAPSASFPARTPRRSTSRHLASKPPMSNPAGN
jgi:hypothetical protein